VRTHSLGSLLLLACLLASPLRAAETAAARLSLSVRGKPFSALLLRPPDARALLVLAHGQIMNMEHPFMTSLSAALAQHGVATLRFNFPYAEAGRNTPDPGPVLREAMLAALREADHRRGALPLLLGGKSMGSALAARATADGALPEVKAVVIIGYPLHPPGRPSALNARYAENLKRPVLFVEGTRDAFADLVLMRGLVEKIGAQATLHVVQGADHAFELPADSGRDEQSVIDEIAAAIERFVATLPQSRGG
jgi:uncharacterized protein